MASLRTDGPVLEQSRRRVRVGLALILLAAGAALVALTRGSHRAEVATAAAGELAYPVPPRENRVLVEVLNTTDRSGLARVAARMLRQDGLDVVNVGNSEPTTERTTVIVRRGDGGEARRVARALGGAAIETRPDPLRRVDLTVLLGNDFNPVLPLHP